MKILIDPIYTGKASTCSTSYLAWEIIQHLAKTRDDAFFYLLAPAKQLDPETRDEKEWAFLSRLPERVTLLPYPYQPQDRIAEMNRFDECLERYLGPTGYECWDWDVCLTSRISQLPFMRNVSGRESNYPHGTPRLFLGMDEMPVFSFRDTVAWAPGGNMDLVSLAAYLSVGGVLMNNLWSKTIITQIARQWLSPSRVQELSDAIHECVPVKLQRLDLKLRPLKKELTVVFAGRMTGTRNFKEVAELFRKQFSYPLGKKGVKVRLIISTNSLSTGSTNHGDISFVEVQHNNREQFHALLDTAHVVVNLSTVEDFSLSTYEPLRKGVPVITLDKPWTSFLGPDYPFRAKGMIEAYAMISSFATDYADEYERFSNWEGSTWKALVEGPRNRTTAEGVEYLVARHEQYIHKRLNETDAGASYKEIVAACDAKCVDTVDALQVARECGRFLEVLPGQVTPIGKLPNLYMLKLYMNLGGWEDTNAPGVFRKPAGSKGNPCN